MKLKIALAGAFFTLAGVAGLMHYDISRMNSETIILCASNDGGILIPGKVCEYYIYNYRNISNDVMELSNGGGLGFILNGGNEEKKYQIAEFFISNGLDVNGVNYYGEYNLTPIYIAVLLNDTKMAEFLLEKGSDLDVKPESIGMTPLDYAKSLQNKDPSINRDKLIAMISERR